MGTSFWLPSLPFFSSFGKEWKLEAWERNVISIIQICTAKIMIYLIVIKGQSNIFYFELLCFILKNLFSHKFLQTWWSNYGKQSTPKYVSLLWLYIVFQNDIFLCIVTVLKTTPSFWFCSWLVVCNIHL